ncbi:allatostatin-A receptor [Lingula anatina]|uniref:Allatostatin-A receptor n=1 Tax=Lingula anatina TaxID=7574 RepID=A0A1S3IAS4_LINAN|nr:allatostatin-A receptor [Lingula anatina]|eukprot:XP_013395268.1 allatostatin-A receptor [Lingula anatina]
MRPTNMAIRFNVSIPAAYAVLEDVVYVSHINDTKLVTEGSSTGNGTEGYDTEDISNLVVAVLFSIIVAVGFLGNLLVLLVIFTNKPMRNTTNILIANLAIADLIFIIICVPFTAAMFILKYWPFGDFWCHFVYYIIYVSAWASIYTMVLMALDRFLTLVLVFRSLTLKTERNTYIVIIVLWVVILLINIPAYNEHGIYVYENATRQRCLDINLAHNREFDAQVFYTCFCLFGYALPLTLTIVLYLLIVRKLYVSNSPERTGSGQMSRARRQLTHVVVIVTAAFAICWLPIHIAFILKVYWGVPQDAVSAFIYFQISAQCLAYMNSCMNPILYAFVYSKFRRGFQKLLCCRRGAQFNFNVETTVRRWRGSSRGNSIRQMAKDERYPLNHVHHLTTLDCSERVS